MVIWGLICRGREGKEKEELGIGPEFEASAPLGEFFSLLLTLRYLNEWTSLRLRYDCV